MKIRYNEEADALYIEINALQPDGVAEVADGVLVDTTATGKITGIEILHASQQVDIAALLAHGIKFDRGAPAKNPPGKTSRPTAENL